MLLMDSASVLQEQEHLRTISRASYNEISEWFRHSQGMFGVGLKPAAEENHFQNEAELQSSDEPCSDASLQRLLTAEHPKCNFAISVILYGNFWK